MGNVLISPNIKRESVRIDPDGNIINARTKQIIQAVETPYIEPAQAPVEAPVMPLEAPPQRVVQINDLSVLDQIAQAKKHLVELEELKKLKIAEKKAELELLEQ